MSESMISGFSQTTDRMHISGKTEQKTEDKAQQGLFADLFSKMPVDTVMQQQTIQAKPVQQTKIENRQESKVQIKQTFSQGNQRNMDSVQKGMQSFEQKVNQLLKDELGVTDEEIADAMEKLGITYASLIQPTNFVQLAAQLTEDGDTSALLINGDFTQTMEQLQELTEDLQTELGMTKEELQSLADEMIQQKNTVSMQPKDATAVEIDTVQEKQSVESNGADTMQNLTDEVQEENNVERKTSSQTPETVEKQQMTNQTKSADMQAETSLTQEGEAELQNQMNPEKIVQSEQGMEENTGKENIVEKSNSLDTQEEEQQPMKTENGLAGGSEMAEQTVVQQQTDAQNRQEKQNGQEEQNQMSEIKLDGEQGQKTEKNDNVVVQEKEQFQKNTQGKQEMTSHMTQGMSTQQPNSVKQTGQTMPMTSQQVDTKAIIEQITKFAKTHISLDGTTISMQLNPQHLGKIYLQASYKNGMLTAQLAAQDSAVKDALEHQISRLQESLNQQGIKVDAIEVTVASHEFEQNLEQNQQLNQNLGQQQQQQQQENRRERRNLNLKEENIQALFEDLSEDDSLKAKMMLENGNSVDMTA